jgi:hypothetical protein
MFNYIGQVEHSYCDYMHLLKYRRICVREMDSRAVELAMENGGEKGGEGLLEEADENVIEIEIREFRELEQKRDIHEYCKPFSFESLVIDSDDVCRIAVIVARKLLDARIDEFSLSMLQAISDVREPLEEMPSDDQELLSFKRQKDLLYKKME